MDLDFYYDINKYLTNQENDFGIFNVFVTILYYGLIIGATLGGNLTPVGASANIASIGKNFIENIYNRLTNRLKGPTAKI